MEEEKNILDHLKVKKNETPNADYFANLANDIITSQKVKSVSFYKNISTWVGLAAASLIITFFIISKTSGTEKENVLLALSDIEQVEIESYIYRNIEDFSTEMIIELIPVVDAADKTETNSVIEAAEDIAENTIPELFNDISEEDILEYFDSEDIELEELEDELYI